LAGTHTALYAVAPQNHTAREGVHGKGETVPRFSHRWSIEITNRDTKDLLGSADPQCRCKESVARAPLMPYWSYCFVVVWFVSQFRMGKDLQGW